MPSSGHGPTQAVLDSISLASLLYDLPSNSAADIEALFRIQFERRGPSAKAAVWASQQQDQLLFNRVRTLPSLPSPFSSTCHEKRNSLSLSLSHFFYFT